MGFENVDIFPDGRSIVAFVLPRIFDSSDESKPYFDCWIVLLSALLSWIGDVSLVIIVVIISLLLSMSGV